MKIFVYVALTLAGLALAGCRFPNGVAENHFAVVATPSMSAPILLNEATGESWRLTDSGWQPIAILKERAVESDKIKPEDIRKEIDRRKQIYDALSQSPEAAKIVVAYKSGETSKDAARLKLQAMVPQQLGSLPPGAEDGNWSGRSK